MAQSDYGADCAQNIRHGLVLQRINVIFAAVCLQYCGTMYCNLPQLLVYYE